MSDNPYQSPADPRSPNESSSSSNSLGLRSAIFTLVVSTFVFAIVGGGIGFCLGYFVPNYYRSVFPQGHTPGFDSIAVGLGQGVSQGAAGGAVIGLVVVALFSWRDRRREFIT